MSAPIFPDGVMGNPVRTFRVVTAVIPFGSPVAMDAANDIVLSTNNSTTIGHVLTDESYEAQNGSTSIAIGDLAQVALRGPVISMLSGSTISAGDRLILDATSRVTNIYTAGSATMVDLLVGVALTAGGSANRVEVVRF